MTTIYETLINAGFDVNQHGEFKVDIFTGITLTIIRDVELREYYIKIQPAGGSLLVTARINHLNAFESERTPCYSMSTHDDLFFNFNGDINVNAVNAKLEQIHLVRQAALELLVAFKSIELTLTSACEAAVKALQAKEALESIAYEAKRLARIESFKKGKVKQGDYLAKKIMSEMESETMKTKETTSKAFVFLVATGFTATKTFSVVWEKGRLSWKSAHNNLLDPIEVEKQIAAVWIPDSAA